MKFFRERTTGQRRFSRRSFVISGSAAVSAISVGALLPVRCNGKFYPGTAVAGVPISGLSKEEARSALTTRLDGFQQTAVTYVYEEKTWRFSPGELGISLDIDSALNQAWSHGRADGLTGRYEALLDRSNLAIPLVVAVDSPTFNTAIDRIAAELKIDPVDATFAMDGTTITVTPDATGRTLDADKARAETLAALVNLQPVTITLRASTDRPAVRAADLEPSRAEAALLVSRKITIRHGDQRWEVDRNALARSIVVPKDVINARPELDAGTLAIILQPIADEMNRDPINADIGWRDKGVYAVSESSDGLAVDLQELANQVIEAAAKESGRIVKLPTSTLKPAIDSDHLDQLGIVTLMAEGASSFAGSADARATNVRVSAEKVGRQAIPPGGSLSFLDAVGKISVDAGFVEGKIISGGWYASDIGGGVCQVSTTVYRAALLAGLPFAEWYPHTFRVSFYELDGWPIGMDAAIYQPNNDGEWALDLVFTNPTDAWILLQMSVEGDTVYARIYGADTDYQVEISDPALSDETQPPEPLEKTSDEVPSGERQQTQQAQPGVTATLTRRVVVDGETLLDDTFISVYAPVADAFVVGTGD